jgi:glycine cleavage system regulatory protein
VGAKRLERDFGLTILLRGLEGEPRPPVPAPGTQLFRIEAAGEDRAGIVTSLCRVLAANGVNIAELSTRSRPGPGGSPHYELRIAAEVPDNLDHRELREALEAEADRLVIDVSLMPA